MAKDKVRKIRLNPRKQAGAVPFKITNSHVLKIMLVKKTGSGKWGFPKGKVEKNQTKKQGALMEAWEEAGVKGKIVGNVGRFGYIKNKTRRMQQVDLYLLEVTKTSKKYLETERERNWFTYKEALKVLPRTQLPFLILAAKMIEEQHGPYL
ncbi:Bis(5'-nucleosyl)-tetraphosphatase (asymmetrical) [Phage NCTB]|nr:Bis(5'-nucleosyl)-tetraphosphatase (asymmetrical) [Phage NCTB]